MVHYCQNGGNYLVSVLFERGAFLIFKWSISLFYQGIFKFY